jgi:hypothetical protein
MAAGRRQRASLPHWAAKALQLRLSIRPLKGSHPGNLYSTTFTYTGGGNILDLVATGGPGGAPPYALLDGVSLVGAGGTPTPEPSTWVMIVAGFAGVGLVARATQVESRPRLI